MTRARDGRRRRRGQVIGLGAAWLVVMVLAAAQHAPPSPPADATWTVLETRPGQGEQCLVCGLQVFDSDVVEIRYQGRTFYVGAALLGDFRDDPDRYFAKLQSRSALFDEEAMDMPPISLGWLWFGMYVLAGLVGAATCGYLAITRSRPALPWFFAGLVGNVAAVVVLLLSPKGAVTAAPAGIPPGLRKVPTTRPPVACRACGAMNHPAARACSGCGVDLDPAFESEVARAGKGG